MSSQFLIIASSTLRLGPRDGVEIHLYVITSTPRGRTSSLKDFTLIVGEVPHSIADGNFRLPPLGLEVIIGHQISDFEFDSETPSKNFSISVLFCQ